MEASEWAKSRWPSAHDFAEHDAAKEAFAAGIAEGMERAAEVCGGIYSHGSPLTLVAEGFSAARRADGAGWASCLQKPQRSPHDE